MNRIVELMKSALYDKYKKDGCVMPAPFGQTEIEAAVTVDISCKFAEWVEASGYKKVYDGHWQTLLLGSPIYTTAQLFNSEEFQKTI